MKRRTIFSIVFSACCICNMVVSVTTATIGTGIAPSAESDGSIGGDDDDEMKASADEPSADYENNEDRIKRQYEHEAHYSPFSGLLSAIFGKKLGLIGSLSSISNSGKGAEIHHHTYEYPAVSVHKPFDWYTFKKTILASLFQAVKAITGGVIALNGQLMKVKGHILTAQGHFLATKGDSVTDFGRHLATHAFTSSHDETPPSHGIYEAPIAPALPTSGSGYGLTGPGNVGVYSPVNFAYPQNDLKSVVGYPSNGLHNGHTLYAKRAIPAYVI